MSNISTTELNGASKESTTVKNGDIKSLNIGKKRFKHMPTVFSDISHLTLVGQTRLMDFWVMKFYHDKNL